MDNNMEAPARIWAVHHDTCGAIMIGEWADTVRHLGGVEYIRADLAAPSAPAEVEGLVDRLRGIALGKLEDEIGLAFDCTRVWEAWSVGTMGQDDFVPITERIDDLVDAAIEPFTTALTAQQAENERLREYYEAREVIRAVGMFNATEEMMDRLEASRAKIKGDV